MLAKLSSVSAAVMAAFFVSEVGAAPCLPAAAGDRLLTQRYGEVPVGRGVAGGRLVLLYAARDGATFTVVLVDPAAGAMCALAEGEGWEAVAPPPPGEPS